MVDLHLSSGSSDGAVQALVNGLLQVATGTAGTEAPTHGDALELLLSSGSSDGASHAHVNCLLQLATGTVGTEALMQQDAPELYFSSSSSDGAMHAGPFYSLGCNLDFL